MYCWTSWLCMAVISCLLVMSLASAMTTASPGGWVAVVAVASMSIGAPIPCPLLLTWASRWKKASWSLAWSLAHPVGDGVLALWRAAGAGAVPQEPVVAQVGDFPLQFAELGNDSL
jgi:hypothetical protein